jgi:hypothetical protein
MLIMMITLMLVMITTVLCITNDVINAGFDFSKNNSALRTMRVILKWIFFSSVMLTDVNTSLSVANCEGNGYDIPDVDRCQHYLICR